MMAELPETPMPTVEAIYDALVAEAAAQERYEGYGISASSLGSPCDRKLWMDLRWVSEPEVMTGRKLRIFARGNAAEARVIADLRRVLDVEDVGPDGRQFRFALANGWLRGKADGKATGVIEAPKALHVIEVKCIKAADWRAIRRHGLAKAKPEHWHQIHAGMAGLGATRGLYIAENADTSEILTERIRFDAEEAARQEARVMRAVEDHEPPLGMLGDATTEKKAEAIAAKPPCRFCPHVGACFAGAWARRHCRTCLHWSFTTNGNGHCARFDEPRKPAQQHEGAHCPAHLFLPALVPGEQIDADPEAETVTYRLRDGAEWVDGSSQNLARNGEASAPAGHRDPNETRALATISEDL